MPMKEHAYSGIVVWTICICNVIHRRDGWYDGVCAVPVSFQVYTVPGLRTC